MSTSNKLTYLNETKQELKQAINNLGGSITDETTFRQYVNQLDGVYDVLPKTEFQEGTDVTIEGGLKGKIDFDTQDGKKIVGYGDTEQDGEPTPSTPVAIQCVTGNQEIVESGKNKFNIGTSLDDYFQTNTNGTKPGSWTVNAVTATIEGNKLTIDTYNSSGWNWLSKWVELEPNTDYTISGTNTSVLKVVGFNSNELQTQGTQIIQKTANASDSVKTFNSGDYKYYCLSCFPEATGKYFENIQIEQGSTATTYEPYQTPQTYQLSLGEYEFAKIGNYVDTIEYDVDNDKVYKNKAINKYTFTGNETGVIQNSGKRFDITCSANNIPICINNSTSSEISPIYCNILVAQSGAATWNGTQGISYNTGNNGQILVSINGKTTQTEYLNVLKDNYCYYVLKEAVKEEITGTLKDQIKALYNSHSFTGTTIIESNGDLPMIIKVRALKGE